MAKVDYEKRIELARRVLVKLQFKGLPYFFTQEEYYGLISSKIVAYSEYMIKKDSKNHILHFDETKYPEAAEVMIELKNSLHFTYTRDLNYTVNITGNNSPELGDAVWFFHKLRDSVVHDASSIDYNLGVLNINNIDPDGRYSLVGSIPIEELSEIITRMIPSQSAIVFDDTYYKNVLFGLKSIVTNESDLFVINKLYELQANEGNEFFKDESIKIFKYMRNKYIDIVYFHDKVCQLIESLKMIISSDNTLDIDLYDAVVYNYLCSLFINEDREIDYARIDTSFFDVDFTTAVNNTYLSKKAAFEKFLDDFFDDTDKLIDDHQEAVDYSKKSGLELRLINAVKRLVNKTYESIAVLNEEKITFFRNAVEHENFHRKPNGDLAFYDTSNTATKEDRINLIVHERFVYDFAGDVDKLSLEHQLDFNHLCREIELLYGSDKKESFVFLIDYVCTNILKRDYRPKESPEHLTGDLTNQFDVIKKSLTNRS